MSIFADRYLSVFRSVLIVALFSVLGALLIQHSPAKATNISGDFTNFITNERGKPASNQQADKLYQYLDSGTLASVCSKSSSYKSGAVNKKDGGESYVSLATWAADGAFELSADWRNKSNSLIQLLNGEVGGGMTLEYSAANDSEGWCSYIVRMATDVKIPIQGKAVTVNNETESKSIETSTIGENCSADFSTTSKNIIGTKAEITTFLNELSTSDYNSFVKKHAVAITSQGAGASACATLVTDLKPQIDAKVAEFCKANPDAEECKEVEVPVTGTASSCVVEAIGWIVCPVTNFLADLADGAFIFLANSFLNIGPQAFKTDEPAYAAWGVMRNIANVVFVIVFIIVIFSQLTGAGVSNYGVKKMLPRLVIAAILVNVSFFITQLAIDISNILGYSIRTVFSSITNSIVQTDSVQAVIEGASPVASGEGFAGVAGLILAGGLAGVALYAMLSTLIPILLAAVLALIMILFILVARQAIVILLVVLAPLAFVAFLLPNTENLFKMWRKILTAMLLLFPIIALVFGASELASQILISAFSGDSTGNVIPGDSENWFGQIIGAAVLVLPLFIVPILLRKSLDSVPMLGQLANKWSGKTNANVGKKARESYGESRFAAGQNYRKQKRATNRVLARSGQYEGNNPFLKARSKVSGALNGKSQFGERLTAQGIDIANKEEATAVGMAEQKLRRESLKNPGAAEATLRKALAAGDAVTARAAQNVLFSQGGGGVGRFFDAVQQVGSAAHAGTLDSLRENISEKHGQFVKSKAADLTTWAGAGGAIDSHFGAITKLSEADLASQTEDTLRRAQQSINPHTARALLDNKQLSGNLDPGQRRILEAVAAPAAPEAQQAPATPTTVDPQATAPLDTGASVTSGQPTAAQPETTMPIQGVAPTGGVFAVDSHGTTVHDQSGSLTIPRDNSPSTTASTQPPTQPPSTPPSSPGTP